jgi:predicted transcriptional regulator
MELTREHIEIYETIVELSKTQYAYTTLVCMHMGINRSCIYRRIEDMRRLGWLREVRGRAEHSDRRRNYLLPLKTLEELPPVTRYRRERNDPMEILHIVYIVICEFIAGGNPSPTIEQIAARACYQSSAVDMAVKTLCHYGCVSRTRACHRSIEKSCYVYSVQFDKTGEFMKAYKKRLVDVHTALQTFICERGYAPSTEDIGKMLHLSPDSIKTYFRQLEEYGVLVMPRDNNGVMEVHPLYDNRKS